jgi:hypothetical protein
MHCEGPTIELAGHHGKGHGHGHPDVHDKEFTSY